MGPPKTRRRRSGTAVQYDGFFFKLVSKHPDPVHAEKNQKEYRSLTEPVGAIDFCRGGRPTDCDKKNDATEEHA